MASPLLATRKTFTWFAKKIGMVFQSYELFPHLDVLQNLILGPIKAQGRDKKEVTEEALRLLERVGLLDKKTVLLANYLVDRNNEWRLSVPCSCIQKLSPLTK